MKRHPQHLSRRRPVLTWLSVLLLGAACHGTGHVREVPRASYPAETPASPAPPPSDRERSRDAEPFATPPDEEAARDETPEPGTGPSTSGPEPWQERASEAPSAPAEAKAASPQRSGGAQDGAQALGHTQSRDDGDAAWRRLPEERPGLATHWGEDRYSPAREVDFVRAEPQRPSLRAELHYNDREGARRMLPDGDWSKAERRLASGVTIRVVDPSGQTLPALAWGGRVVAVGAPGERYALAIENPTAQRFEVVASVDGLDVLDGQAARADKRGYLVAAYSSVSIDGFRRSNEEVAAFRLGNVARSYAASKGQSSDVGVIGFAFFDERRPRVLEPREPWYRRSSEDTRLRRRADPFPGEHARPPVW